jgi:hypothetical protein
VSAASSWLMSRLSAAELETPCLYDVEHVVNLDAEDWSDQLAQLSRFFDRCIWIEYDEHEALTVSREVLCNLNGCIVFSEHVALRGVWRHLAYLHPTCAIRVKPDAVSESPRSPAPPAPRLTLLRLLQRLHYANASRS